MKGERKEINAMKRRIKLQSIMLVIYGIAILVAVGMLGNAFSAKMQLANSGEFNSGCGDGVCVQGEELSCPIDCTYMETVAGCGNGLCEYGETCYSCSPDCGSC